MKKYFEYPMNDSIKKRILEFYQKQGSGSFGQDNGARKVHLKLDRIAQHIDFDPEDVICDVGCSEGALLRYLHGKYKRGVGLDIAQNVIEHNIAVNPYDNVTYAVYDGVTLIGGVHQNLFDGCFGACV